MNYYDAFLYDSQAHPSDSYKIAYQELVNQEFYNSPTYQSDVEEEVDFGTLSFKPCPCRIVQLTNSTTGLRINDDYRKIIFPDNDYRPKLGARYRFNDNIWIINSTDNHKSITSSAYLRRCNNYICTQDEYDNIHREPVFIDYSVNENQLTRTSEMEVPNGRLWVQGQYNNWTARLLKIDTRIMFSGYAYKIREIHHFNLQETFNDNSNSLFSFYADLDALASTDNVELNIADYKCIDYQISTKTNISGRVGEQYTISYDVLLNGDEVSEEVEFTGYDESVISISGNVVTFLAEGSTTITAQLKNNNKYFTNIEVECSNEIEEVYEDVLSPATDDNFFSIRINATQKFSIFEYKNGVKQDTQFTIECFDMPKSNYQFILTDNNNFSIKNLKTTEDYILKIVCTNQRTGDSTNIYIQLGGLF